MRLALRWRACAFSCAKNVPSRATSLGKELSIIFNNSRTLDAGCLPGRTNAIYATCVCMFITIPFTAAAQLVHFQPSTLTTTSTMCAPKLFQKRHGTTVHAVSASKQRQTALELLISLKDVHCVLAPPWLHWHALPPPPLAILHHDSVLHTVTSNSPFRSFVGTSASAWSPVPFCPSETACTSCSFAHVLPYA